MNIEVISIGEFGKQNWDNLCTKYSLTLNYYAYFLDYLAVTYETKNESYVLLVDDLPSAVVPWFGDLLEVEIPGIVQFKPFDGDDQLIGKFKPEGEKIFNFEFSTWANNWSYVIPDSIQIQPFKNLVVDLKSLATSPFTEISRGHRRTIVRSMSQGQRTLVIDSASNATDIDFFFDFYRRAHFEAAGRQTRNNQSFELMKQYISEGKAILFVAENSGRPRSFLYCDYTNIFSRGWSQANLLDLNQDEYPRHQLELESMLHFASIGSIFYHLGQEPLDLTNATNKERSIFEFKSRFHPLLFEGYKSLKTV